MQLSDLKWPDIAALSRDMPIVIPIAALEQHGRHMPLFTDSLLLGEVIRRVSERLKDRILFTPLMWLGNSEHHLDFPGTMTAAPRVYLDLLKDMVENFLFHGFRRIVLVNGHGGNIVPAQQAMFELRQKHRQRGDLLLLSTTYWTLGAKPQQKDSTFMQHAMGHACEWETSMMLRIRPELVGDYKAVQPVSESKQFEPAHRAWTTKDLSEPGHIGQSNVASAEKGETLFRLFADDVTVFLERVVAWKGGVEPK
ncbi:MAG: creatininase family protein [Planctomycetia bacterium]|jgi:creatinine amidohydrolase|nr:creatininase family protein [Planctomycetia bacterium]